MGTGNDMSRVIGWGSLEPNHKNIVQYVADIHFCAKITKRWSDLDRWRISWSFDCIEESEHEFYSQLIRADDDCDHKRSERVPSGSDIDAPDSEDILGEDIFCL